MSVYHPVVCQKCNWKGKRSLKWGYTWACPKCHANGYYIRPVDLSTAEAKEYTAKREREGPPTKTKEQLIEEIRALRR